MNLLKDRFQFVKHQNSESFVFVPNELFEILQQTDLSFKHQSIIYSYYVFNSWLFRYCKYFADSGFTFTMANIKEFLGYKADDNRIDKLIGNKPTSVINQLGLTESTTDYPIQYFNEKWGVEFMYFSDKGSWDELFYKVEDKFVRNPAYNKGNFKVKKPLLEFDNPDNTHKVSINEIVTSLDNKEVGCMGLYIFGWLKHQINIHQKGFYSKYVPTMARELGLNEKTLRKYLHSLQEAGFIRIEGNGGYDKNLLGISNKFYLQN